MRIRTLTALAALALPGLALADEAPETATTATTASASFVDAQGQANGSAELAALASGGVLIALDVTGLPPGAWVAVHVHETGACDHATGHESAGGHFNPTSSEHGFKVAAGPHAGDMPNQRVGEDGALRAEIVNARVTLDTSEAGVMGRALMVHAGPDDYESQPSGDAGARLACGVIE